MSKRLVVSVIVCSVVAGIAIGYVRGLPDDFVENDTAVQGASEYGYRCGDGTEFTIIPARNLSTVRIIPATSVDYVHNELLHQRTTPTGISFSGGGITLRPSGVGLMLATVSHGSTMCSPMNREDETLFERLR